MFSPAKIAIDVFNTLTSEVYFFGGSIILLKNPVPYFFVPVPDRFVKAVEAVEAVKAAEAVEAVKVLEAKKALEDVEVVETKLPPLPKNLLLLFELAAAPPTKVPLPVPLTKKPLLLFELAAPPTKVPLPVPPTKVPLLLFELAAPLIKDPLLPFELPTLLITPDEPLIELFFNNEEITATNASSVELLLAVQLASRLTLETDLIGLSVPIGDTREESVIEVWLLDVDTATSKQR